jgi:PiT family inorganic phosphate transporter
MYLVSEVLRLMKSSGKPTFTAPEQRVLDNYRAHVDRATKFIPGWGKWL